MLNRVEICPVCGRKIRVNYKGFFTAHHVKKPTRKRRIGYDASGVIFIPDQLCPNSWKSWTPKESLSLLPNSKIQEKDL